MADYEGWRRLQQAVKAAGGDSGDYCGDSGGGGD